MTRLIPRRRWLQLPCLQAILYENSTPCYGFTICSANSFANTKLRQQCDHDLILESPTPRTSRETHCRFSSGRVHFTHFFSHRAVVPGVSNLAPVVSISYSLKPTAESYPHKVASATCMTARIKIFSLFLDDISFRIGYPHKREYAPSNTTLLCRRSCCHPFFYGRRQREKRTRIWPLDATTLQKIQHESHCGFGTCSTLTHFLSSHLQRPMPRLLSDETDQRTSRLM